MLPKTSVYLIDLATLHSSTVTDRVLERRGGGGQPALRRAALACADASNDVVRANTICAQACNVPGNACRQWDTHASLDASDESGRYAMHSRRPASRLAMPCCGTVEKPAERQCGALGMATIAVGGAALRHARRHAWQRCTARRKASCAALRRRQRIAELRARAMLSQDLEQKSWLQQRGQARREGVPRHGPARVVRLLD